MERKQPSISNKTRINRTGDFNNTTIGLAIEIYNSIQDPTLTEILATTSVITTADDVYRFDFPDIATYTGFSTGESLTNIIREEDATSEVVSVAESPTEMEGGLSVDTITTTGNIYVGGVITAPNQIGFLAFSKSSLSVSGTNTQKLPYNQVKYNIGGHYDTTTYIFTCPLVGRYLFFVNYFTISGNSATVDLIRDDGTTEITILRSQGSASPSNNEGRSAHIVIDCNIGDQLYGLMRNDAIRLSPFTYSDDSIYGPFGVQLLS